MKKISIVVLLIFDSFNSPAQTIDFLTESWGEAVQLAEKKQKYIFLYARTKSCRYCHQMEAEVFTQPEVMDYYNTNFINFKIDIDDGGVGQALSKQFGLIGFPTYLYFDRSGTKLHQSSSSKSGADFIKDGKNAYDPNAALFLMLNRYERGENSSEFLFNLSSALQFYLGDPSLKDKIISEYLKTQNEKELESEKNLNLIFRTYLDFSSSVTQHLLLNHKKFKSLFGDKSVDARVQKIVTRAAQTAGERNDSSVMISLRRIIALSFSDTSKMSSLTRIYFFAGQRDWLNYAKSTLAYASYTGSNDWQTMYETGSYLKYFADDPQALEIGIRIMQKVLQLQKNYEHLCLYAHLHKKLGNKTSALAAAKEALKFASVREQDKIEAAELIAELGIKAK